MLHRATAAFWSHYDALPQDIRNRADKQFAFLKANTQHPSVQFKKIGDRHGQEVWSARVSSDYRALAIKRTDGYLWFWIGDHKTYEMLLS
jgi:hypothetical protein